MAFPQKQESVPGQHYGIPDALSHAFNFAKPQRVLGQIGIEKGMSVADFGAGSGAYTLEAADLVGAHGHVYAIDVQKDLLIRIKNQADREGKSNVEIVLGSIETRSGTHLADGIVDYVVLSNTLFQTDDKKGTLLEAMRVMKERGFLVLIEWSDESAIGPHKNHVISQKDAEALALSLGLVLVREFDAGAHHYGLLYRKSEKNR